MSAARQLLMLRTGFEEGLFSRDDVRAWVDSEMARLDELPAALLELATIAHKSDPEIVELLRALEPDVAAAVQAHVGVAVLAALYAARRVSLRDAIARLSSMATFNEGLSEDERPAIYELDVALDLAAEGVYGTVDDVRERLEAFLADYPMMSRGGAQSL